MNQYSEYFRDELPDNPPPKSNIPELNKYRQPFRDEPKIKPGSNVADFNKYRNHFSGGIRAPFESMGRGLGNAVLRTGWGYKLNDGINRLMAKLSSEDVNKVKSSGSNFGKFLKGIPVIGQAIQAVGVINEASLLKGLLDGGHIDRNLYEVSMRELIYGSFSGIAAAFVLSIVLGTAGTIVTGPGGVITSVAGGLIGYYSGRKLVVSTIRNFTGETGIDAYDKINELKKKGIDVKKEDKRSCCC